MSEVQTIDMQNWFSTYGLITSERILGRYQIKLAGTELVTAIKKSSSFYHKLVETPVRHVLNGIILQQAHDYHVYAQKLFIDYMLSGENSKGPEEQGAHTRERLEEERQALVHLGDEFNKKQLEHQNLIAQTQAELIKVGQNFNKLFEKTIASLMSHLKQFSIDKATCRRILNQGLIHGDFTPPTEAIHFAKIVVDALGAKQAEQLLPIVQNDLAELLTFTDEALVHAQSMRERSEEMTFAANGYRTRFYESILRIIEQLKLLPEYKIDPVQDGINRETLYFDPDIGAVN